MIIPSADLGYATCQEVVTLVAASTTDELSEDCLVIRAAVEAFCCPSAAYTCSICQGAELYGDVELPTTDGSIYTCGQFAFDLGINMLDIASQECIAVQTVEELCCPDAFVPQPVVPSTSLPISIPSPSPTDFIGISILFPTYGDVFVCGSDYDDASKNCTVNTACPSGGGCPYDKATCFSVPEERCLGPTIVPSKAPRYVVYFTS